MSKEPYEREGLYRPAVFVDEIGLTSDKYVVLNETVRELPLKISFGPLSLQVLFIVVIAIAAVINASSPSRRGGC